PSRSRCAGPGAGPTCCSKSAAPSTTARSAPASGSASKPPTIRIRQQPSWHDPQSRDSPEPDLLLGYPYTINQDMPAVAPSAKAVAFGDFSKYFVRRIVSARVLRLDERYVDYNQVAFIASQ